MQVVISIREGRSLLDPHAPRCPHGRPRGHQPNPGGLGCIPEEARHRLGSAA